MLEIERKFLIAYPTDELLNSFEGVVKKDICQTYLLSPSGLNERVRKVIQDGTVTYYHTRKSFISKLTRQEAEEQIGEEEYNQLLAKADPACAPLYKTRYCIPYKNGSVLEIDVYPFWKNKAVLEIELESENSLFSIPSGIKVIREISGEKKYSNIHLAKTKAKELQS